MGRKIVEKADLIGSPIVSRKYSLILMPQSFLVAKVRLGFVLRHIPIVVFSLDDPK
jgi:hypothetical protein